MKTYIALTTLVLAILIPSQSVLGANPDDLVKRLREAVERARVGDFNETVRITNAAAVNPKAPTKAMDLASKLQEIYRSVEGLGELDEIEQVSLRFVGESFFRLRIVDKRSKGVILWTFIGYRFKDEWYCEGVSIAANSDLRKLMRDELDAADVGEVVEAKTAEPGATDNPDDAQ